jgi:hypothetical protein
VFFQLGDITSARTLDPFTHVYMFDIGFPPSLFAALAQRFNASASTYLASYHGPRIIVQRYGFNVELIVKTPTSMHGREGRGGHMVGCVLTPTVGGCGCACNVWSGSSEGHTAYLYRRTGTQAGGGDARAQARGRAKAKAKADPLFAEGLGLLAGEGQGGLGELRSWVAAKLHQLDHDTTPRSARRRQQAKASASAQRPAPNHLSFADA